MAPPTSCRESAPPAAGQERGRRGVTVLTFGAFDLFHLGHVRLLQRAAEFGDRLIVGVSCDAYVRAAKGREPVFGEQERLEIVRACRHVDEAFLNGPEPIDAAAIARHGAQVVVFGDDWAGRYDHLRPACQVVYLPRTALVSTSALRDRLAQA